MRHHEDLAVPIREAKESSAQRLPACLLTFNPYKFRRRAIHGIGDPADGWLHRAVGRVGDVMIAPHVAVEAPPFDPIDPVFWGPESLLVREEKRAVRVEADAVGGAETRRQDFGACTVLADT